MKRHFGGLLGLAVATAAFLGLTGVSHAGVITWSGPTAVSSASDVLNNVNDPGTTLLNAVAYGSSETVNGVAFTQASGPGGGAPGVYSNTAGGATISVTSDLGLDPSGYNSNTASTGDTNYNTLLSQDVTTNNYGYTEAMSISGLTAGVTYQIQVWSDRGRATNFLGNSYQTDVIGADGGAVDLAGYVDPTSLNGQYATGTFVANVGGTQNFTWGGYTGVINAIQLRSEAPEAPSAPEPASLGLLGLGALSMLCRRPARKVA